MPGVEVALEFPGLHCWHQVSRMSHILEKMVCERQALCKDDIFPNFRPFEELPCPFNPSGVRGGLRCDYRVAAAVTEEAVGGDVENSPSIQEHKLTSPLLGRLFLGARPRHCWFSLPRVASCWV